MMTMKIPSLYTAALCLFYLELVSCAPVDGRTLPKDTNPASLGYQMNADRLSSKIFPAEITDILSPEMFSQSDPLVYFLEKTVKFSYDELKSISQRLEKLLCFPVFPSRYIPYAELLKNLVLCQLSLDEVRYNIKYMRRRSFKSDDNALTTSSLSPELAGLFSSDIFLDDKYPSRLIVKLANFPENRISGLWNEYRIAYYEDKLPQNFRKYSAALWRITLYDLSIPKLVASVSKLRNIISAQSSATLINNESDSERS